MSSSIGHCQIVVATGKRHPTIAKARYRNIELGDSSWEAQKRLKSGILTAMEELTGESPKIARVCRLYEDRAGEREVSCAPHISTRTSEPRISANFTLTLTVEDGAARSPMKCSVVSPRDQLKTRSAERQTTRSIARKLSSERSAREPAARYPLLLRDNKLPKAPRLVNQGITITLLRYFNRL